MYRPRRRRDTKLEESVEEPKNVVEPRESATEPKQDVVNNQSTNQEPVGEVKIQEERPKDSSDKGKQVSAEKMLEVLDLQSKYRELSDNMKSMDQKLSALNTLNVLGRPAFSEKTDETSKVLEGLRKDLNSFLLYGKLFLGIGVAALLLYLITAIVNLANSLRPAAA